MMPSVLDVLGKVARVGGATLEGYGLDRAQRVKDTLARDAATREAERDRVLNALAGAQTQRLLTPEAPELVSGVDPKTGQKSLVPKVPGVVTELAPAPEAPDLVAVEERTATGAVRRVLRPEVEGLEVAGPNNIMAGTAALRKAVANNKSQLAVLDDALAELERRPDAVGLKRGIGEIIPLAGGVQDAINQRADPEGIAARAQISNIGSLEVHDRSGAAVSVSEFARLKPFIPGVGDTPGAVRTKLEKLRKALATETAELEKSMTTRPGTADGAPVPTDAIAAWLAARRKQRP